MSVHNSPTTIADTVIAMVIASKVKHAHFRLPQQFTIISNHCAAQCTGFVFKWNTCCDA